MAGRGNHVMLSYNWDHQDMVSEIYERLTAEGIPCWMDIKGNMAGCITVLACCVKASTWQNKNLKIADTKRQIELLHPKQLHATYQHCCINDAMADGAERAALIVSFCTAKYQSSKNCRRELMYADQEGVRIIPVPKVWKLNFWK